MAHKILITLDGSAEAWQAVEYVADVFARTPGVQVTLLHVQPGLPGEFLAHGRILSEPEAAKMGRVMAEWERDQKQRWQALVGRARRRLGQAGLAESAIRERFRPKDLSVAETIIEEAKRGQFSTIVMGRRAASGPSGRLLGSVSNRVIQSIRGCAVTIVE